MQAFIESNIKQAEYTTKSASISCNNLNIQNFNKIEELNQNNVAVQKKEIVTLQKFNSAKNKIEKEKKSKNEKKELLNSNSLEYEECLNELLKLNESYNNPFLFDSMKDSYEKDMYNKKRVTYKRNMNGDQYNENKTNFEGVFDSMKHLSKNFNDSEENDKEDLIYGQDSNISPVFNIIY